MRAARGLGSNVGDRAAPLARAVDSLRDRVRVLAVSASHETEPVGGPPQGRYLNAAVVVDTDLAPDALLALARGLEDDAGRDRGERWGPRTLDVDVLLVGDREIRDADLVVPHPRMKERRFVLAPLAEIAPDWVVPGDGRRVEDLLADL
jgi:2-amino-4-hydroxy-6-hydroxymethyldihydropteridine diphosphokinase